MNANETAKITPGKCEARFIWACTCGHQGGHWNVFMENGEQIPKLSEADAKFIAEAFNVYRETGLTPRQLAEDLRDAENLIESYRKDCKKLADQRAELLEAARNMEAVLRRIQGTLARYSTDDELQDPLETVNALLGIAEHKDVLAKQVQAGRAIQRATGEQP